MFVSGDKRGTVQQFRAISLISLCCFLLLVTVSGVLYSNVILAWNDEHVAGIIRQYSDSMEQISDQTKQLVQTLAYDTAVSQYLTESDPYARHLFSEQVSAFFASVKAVQDKTVAVFLFRPEEAESAFLRIAANQREILSRLRTASAPTILGLYAYQAVEDDVTVLMGGCNIYDIADVKRYKEPIGGIAVAVNFSLMESLLSDLSRKNGISHAIVNERGELIMGDMRALDPALLSRALARRAEDGEGSVSSLGQEIVITPILGARGYLLIGIDRFVMLGDLWQVIAMALLLALAIYILLLRVFREVRASIARPIDRLIAALRAMNGDAKRPRRVPVEGNLDIRLLSTTLNQMMENESRLTGELLDANSLLYESELSQKRLELQFLRSQINPHFLYNTLEVIRSIALVRHTGEIAEMAKSLAAILRYSIKGGESVPLCEELRVVECYLSIQHMRFSGRFEHCFDIAPEAENLLIPRMCLQPLVENAVMHGLEESMETGHLRLEAKAEADDLVITVADDGVGMSAEKVASLNEIICLPLSARAVEGERNIGLINVARRIQIARGSNFGMRIESVLGAGTTVTIRLPVGKGR